MIVPMKKATLVAFKEDKEALIVALQRCGELMIIPPQNSEFTAGKSGDDQTVQRADNMLKFIARYQGKKSFFAQRPEIDYQKFMHDNLEADKLEDEIERIAKEMSFVQGELGSLKSQLDLFIPWMDLNIPLDALSSTKCVEFYTGYVSPGVSEVIKEIADKKGAFIQLLGIASEGRAVMIACHVDEAQAIMQDIKASGFIEAKPPKSSLTAAESYQNCQVLIEKAQQKIISLDAQALEYAKRKEEIEIIHDQSQAHNERLAAGHVETDAVIYIEGWVRSDRIDKVQKAVENTTQVFELTFADPLDDEKPPTVEKNNWFITPFEVITDMFSRPDPRDVDPNPVLGPWYWLIFGMMMGDAGYGIVMLIFFSLFKKVKKPKGEFGKLIDVFQLSSITTFIWGVLFGSWFGATWMPILMVPLDEPVNMLILCFVVGALHIFSGMGIKMYILIKSGDIVGALLDQLTWIVLLTGLGLMFLPKLAGIGKIMAISCAVIIFLTAGRDKKSIVGKIGGGFLSLYNIVGPCSDIMSYSRILALSLSTGVVAMVMNLLAGMVQTSIFGFFCSLFIYFFGHTFNLVMGLLSAYVHSSRLQYIEFFGKFYEGNGYAFTPLAIRSKYVDVVDR